MKILLNLIHPSVVREEVLKASAAEFWFQTALVLGTALLAFYLAFLYFKRTRIIEDTPTSKIRSAAQGYVELTGYADSVDGVPIVAPLSRTPCIWYRYRVEKSSNRQNRVVETGVSDDLFMLVGKTGRCVVDPDGATVVPAVKKVWFAQHYPSASYPTGGLFNRNFTGRYKLVEERVHAGDPLYAIGLFHSVGGENHPVSNDDELKALLKEWKQQKSMLLNKFDANRDGQLDIREWENVRRAAKQVVVKQRQERALQPVTHMLTRPKEREQLFLLSTVPQHHLTRRWKLYAFSAFLGFLLAGSLATWILSIRF